MYVTYKMTDNQLQGYGTADLCLYFGIYENMGFLMLRLIYKVASASLKFWKVS